MKEKYLIKESNGWWYEGRYYIEGSDIELTKAEHSALKEQVKLEPVDTNKKQ